MTLPTGDADQTIIWKLVVQMQQAQTDIETFKKQVTELKALIRQTADETGSSFKVAAEVIEQQLDAASKSAKKSLAETRADLKRLQSELRAMPKPTSAVGDTAAVTRTAKQDEIKVKETEILAIKQRIAEATTVLNTFRQQSTLALSELNREARNAAAGVATITPSAQQIEEEFGRLTTTGQTAFQGITASTQQATQATQTYFQQLSTMSLDQKIESLKAKLLETQQITGQSLKQISANFKQTFKTEAQQTIDEFKSKIQSANAELKVLQATIANPPTNVGTNQIAVMQQRAATLTNQLPQLQSALKQVQQALQSTNTALGQATQQASKTSDGFNLLGVKINGLGDIVRLVFITLFGGSVLSILSRFSRELEEAIQKANVFVKALFQLEVGIRALRRAGIDITLRETLNQLDKINASVGNLFSKVQLIEGAAQFTNLIRNLGFTKDEIYELQEAVATFAVINGRAMDDVQRTVALALSSGYTEGLQRLGVSINRVTIAERALQEGFEGGYNALTEQVRAEITRRILLEQAAFYARDLTEYQKTLAGSIEVTNAQILDQKVLLGRDVLPLQRAWNELMIAFYNVLRLVTLTFSPLVSAMDAFLQASKNINYLDVFTKEFWTVSGRKAAESCVEAWYSDVLSLLHGKEVTVDVDFNFKKPKISIIEGTFGDEADLGASAISEAQEQIFTALDRLGINLEDLEQEIADKREKINEDLQKDLQKIESDGIANRIDLLRDYNKAIAELEQDTANKRAELARELTQDLSDIDLKLGIDIDEAKLRNVFDVDEVQRKFLEDVAKAQQEYRQKELERERKFQEELLRLREDYLIDLEEALENRDARAVLRARRQYNLDKQRAIRANELEKLEGKEGLQNELRDLAQRRDARLRELEFELQQRIAALQRQAQFEREEKQREYERDLEELRLKLQRESYERWIDYLERKQRQEDEEKAARTKRLLQYEEEKKELQQFLDDKLAIIIQSLKDQAIALGIGSEEMKRIIEAYFGEGGLALTIMDAYADAIEETVARLKRLQAGFAGSFSGVDASKFFVPSKTGKSTALGFASGGAVIARKPTEVTFGEVPEVAIFAPLNQLDKLPSLLGSATEGNVGTQNGNLGIRISLTPGLEAEIIEQSMDKIANIMFEVQRQ